MKTYTFTGPTPGRIHHEAGEIAWADFRNVIENPNADGKPRPVVIVSAGQCCHTVIGLTTREFRVFDGGRRVPLAVPALAGSSYLWSDRVYRLSRINFRRHIGWLGEDQLLVILRSVQIPRVIVSEFQLGVFRHHRAGVMRENATPGGNAGVLGTACWGPGNVARGSRAAHQIGNDCRGAVGRAILKPPFVK